MSAKGQIVFSVNPRPWKRARTRLPTSCGPCRRRKSRCDKGKPCGSCQKSKTADVCHYDDGPDGYEPPRGDFGEVMRKEHGFLVSSESTTSSSGEVNGQLSPSTILPNEYDGLKHNHSGSFTTDPLPHPATPLLRSSVLDQATTNMSTLSLIALQSEDHLREVAALKAQIEVLKRTVDTQKESILELSKSAGKISSKLKKRKVRGFAGYAVKDSKLTFYGPTAYMSLLLDDKYTREIFMEYQREQLQTYEEFSEVQETEASNCDVYSGPTPSNMQQSSNNDPTTEVTASVTNDLPPLSTVKLLVERFFKFCYPFAPFIEKAAFLRELDLAIRDNGEHAKLSFESRRYNAIAILLVMLRFAYLTIPFKDYPKGKLSEEDTRLVELFKNSSITISPNYVDVAYRLMMSSLSGLRRVNLPFIQGLLLIRVYKMYCPEDDDNMQDTGLLQSLIVQLCRQHGINKDPTGCPLNILSVEKVYIWKKLWTMVRFTDASYAFNSGGMILADDGCDSGINGEEKGDIFEKMGYDLSSVVDKPFITRKLCLFDKVTKLMRRVASEMYQQQFTCVEDLISISDALKAVLDNDLRSFEQLYNNESFSIFQGSVAERVEEFLLRCDVTLKVFHLNMVLFEILEHDSDEELSAIYNKNTFLGSALENFLTLMKISDKHECTQNLMFGCEYVSVSMGVVYKALQKMAGPVCTVIMRALERVVSINELAVFFRSADSAGLAAWAGLDWQNESASLFNLFQGICLLSNRSLDASKHCLGAHRLHAVLRNCIPYLKKLYPFLCEETPSDTKIYSTVSLNYDNSAEGEGATIFSDIDELWKKRAGWDASIDFDYLFSHLNDSGYDPMALQSGFFQQVQ